MNEGKRARERESTSASQEVSGLFSFSLSHTYDSSLCQSLFQKAIISERKCVLRIVYFICVCAVPHCAMGKHLAIVIIFSNERREESQHVSTCASFSNAQYPVFFSVKCEPSEKYVLNALVLLGSCCLRLHFDIDSKR